MYLLNDSCYGYSKVDYIFLLFGRTSAQPTSLGSTEPLKEENYVDEMVQVAPDLQQPLECRKTTKCSDLRSISGLLPSSDGTTTIVGGVSRRHYSSCICLIFFCFFIPVCGWGVSWQHGFGPKTKASLGYDLGFHIISVSLIRPQPPCSG